MKTTLLRLDRSRQKGFALLTVLMIVALIAMMGSQLLYDQHTNIKRSSHMLHQAQSFAVQWGFESWVKEILIQDAEDNTYDSQNEHWGQIVGPMPYEGGELSARLIDLQGRLNLNNVMDVAGATNAEEQARQRAVWGSVLKRYAEQNALNESFADVVTDWVDTDDIPSAYGAESNQYLLRKPAYSAADQPMVMLSELKLMEGLRDLTREQWVSLQQDLTALPRVTSINVNTAERRVLIALADWLTEEVADRWINERLISPAEKMEQFIDFAADSTGIPAETIKKDLPDWMISVNSQYFLLNTQVDYGESQQGLSAIFFRESNDKVVLVQRWLSAE